MNYIIVSLISILISLSAPISIPYHNIEKAFTSGDATKIVNFGTPKMLISIEGKEGVYSKSQGKQVLEHFFKKNPPKSFSFDIKGDDDDATFAVANLRSTRDFRVTFKFKKERGDHLIESITISPIGR